MRLSNLERRPQGLNPRGVSPNSFAARGNPNISVHSQHLWNMMQDIELFPDEIYQLLRYEERNLSSYKKAIEREKYKVGQAIDSLKRQMEHNIDDMKISIYAQLDRIYRNYMEKYANMKGQIMEIKRLKDEIELSIESRNFNYTAKYEEKGQPKYGPNTNASILKSMQKNTIEAKKYQMSNYIAELQRDKIIPISQISRELVILTQYENGYYQQKEFQMITNSLIDSLKSHLRDIYERKYQFIREPETICQKQSKPILEQLNDNYYYNSETLGHNNNNNNYRPNVNLPTNPNILYPEPKKTTMGQPGKMDETKFIRISPEQQNITFEWAQNISLVPSQAIQNAAGDIILCALEVERGIVAVGSKDGVITIYEGGQKKANLRGHRASICKLALVTNGGKRFLASGSDHGCSSIVLWDINSWNLRMKLEYHKAAVTAIVDLQDGRSLISGSYDKAINVYNLNDEGKLLFNLPANRASVTAVLLNCNGNKLITCGLDDTLSVHQIMRGANRQVETMFLERQIQNNTMICSIVASALNPELVFLGTKDGKVKLINIERGQAYKIYSICSSAVIEMVVVQRQSKPEFPLTICWPCAEECIKLVNTQSGRVTTQLIKGFIEFGCGIGPKSFFLSNGRTLAMLSQSKQRQQINLYRFDVAN